MAALSAPAGGVERWLAEHFGLTATERALVSRGAPAAVVLPSSDGSEIALLGAIRIAAAPEGYAARIRDITRFKRGPRVEDVGTFSWPASPNDLASLTLTDEEIRALRRCRAGDCDLQLSQSMLDAMRQVTASRGPREAYVAAFRRALTDMVREYQRHGLGALPTYVDDDTAVRVEHEAARLVAEDRRVLSTSPVWRRRLLAAPTSGGGVTSLVYWSRERIGRASVVSVTHLLVGPADGLAPGAWVATSLQLYASHYFDTSLGITLLWPEEPGSTLIYYNRSRVDTFDGLFGRILRRRVRSRARDALRTYLIEVRNG